MQRPVIVAMKGHPGTGKSTLARAIASALRCPLIDKDQVRNSTLPLQRALAAASSAAAASELLNAFAYDVVWELASAQTSLGLSVVVDTPLSRAAHLGRLQSLAEAAAAFSSRGAHLVVVVECRPSDEGEWRRRLEGREARDGGDGASWHKPATWRDLEVLMEGYGGCTDYDVGGGVAKLVVDTTAGGVALEEMVSSVLKFIAAECD